METQLLDNLRGKVSDEALANIHAWLTEPKYALHKDELIALIQAGDYKALEDAFYTVIAFGTGGRRGMTGVGSNRINKITIGESAQALCQYAKKADPDAATKGIAIAYDTRLSSKELSRFAAQVCAAAGFKTYLFEDFRATPELSFAVRELGAIAGIVISASHNPPTDNGFKAYWSDGGQIVPPHDQGILDEAAAISEVIAMDFDEAVRDGKITMLGSDMDQKYLAALLAEAEGDARDLHIVYSPLHGAGQTNTLKVLEAAGFTNVERVEAQMPPDGNFPTIPTGKPNPEEAAANTMAVEQMMASGADIAITNDPDADRIGVMVRQGETPIMLNGNQSAVLAADFVLAQQQAKGRLRPTDYIAKTIVTTDMLDALAKAYGVNVYGNMLIGFKYIGETILKTEGTQERFIIGGEESYGLLKGTYARDKDGAIGALLLAEYAAELKAAGKTLYDRLIELYSEHGIYVENLATAQFPGADGFKNMQRIMQELRSNPPTELGGYPVSRIHDYSSLTTTELATGATTTIDCITGNVVVFELGDSRRRVTVRPSGTEPKLKLYLQWFEDSKNPSDLAQVEADYQATQATIDTLASTLVAQFTA